MKSTTLSNPLYFLDTLKNGVYPTE